jgi:hypothetical protein
MNEKKLKELCHRIYGFFDDLRGEDYGEQFPISNGLDYYKWMKDAKFDPALQDKAADILFDVRSVYFAFGYVMGQSFEITYPEARKDIEVIKKVIKEKALLPYFPRERKERRMP